MREGVFLADLLRTSRDKFPEGYNTSVRYILDAHVDNQAHSNQINIVAKELFDLMHKELNIDENYRYELAIAAKLCMSGSTIHYYSYNKHSYELIEDALEFGFTHKQIV
ncbi:MAG: Ppx/GppA family phosphatase, partial [Sulfurimonadaceae bacterium]